MRIDADKVWIRENRCKCTYKKKVEKVGGDKCMEVGRVGI